MVMSRAMLRLSMDKGIYGKVYQFDLKSCRSPLSYMEVAAELSEKEYTGTQVIGDHAGRSPLIICFHGSGESCSSWVPLAQELSKSYRILLYDRGSHCPKPKMAVAEMTKYLAESKLEPPYVLVAHSYGGNISREFLQQRPQDVVGMVLAETGQETPLDAKLEKKQYRRQILGKKPLSVIRCNSFLGKWKQYETGMETANESQRVELLGQKQLLDAWDKEDEKLKKQQMKLSNNSRYVHVRDCGHHVIRDRPDVVAEEVRWVMETWDTVGMDEGLWHKVSRMMGMFK